jgi:hypothetical protein
LKPPTKQSKGKNASKYRIENCGNHPSYTLCSAGSGRYPDRGGMTDNIGSHKCDESLYRWPRASSGWASTCRRAVCRILIPPYEVCHVSWIRGLSGTGGMNAFNFHSAFSHKVNVCQLRIFELFLKIKTAVTIA